MKSLCIVKPLSPVLIVGNHDLARLLTPDPKEAVALPKEGGSITLDFGVPVEIDTAYVGYHSADPAVWAVGTNDGNPSTGIISPLSAVTGMRPPGQFYGLPFHNIIQSPASKVSRYWQMQFGSQATGYSIGVIALGLSWSSQWGQEMGAGRTIEDTSTVERLQSGGFGIDEGAIIGGYQWTFGDLQKDEIASLYRLVKSVGISRPILVVEDPEQTDGLNERIHWGLFGGLDAYQRLDPANWRWALSVKDWA